MPSTPSRPFLTLRPTALLAACFLAVAAVVLAYLGGVMSGRMYWRSHAKQLEDLGITGAAAPAPESGTEEDAGRKILTPEELRYARVLRNDHATGDAPLRTAGKPAPPRPAAAPRVPAPVAPGVRGPATVPAAPQPVEAAGPPSAAPVPGEMYDYVFQVGAFKDEDAVDALRQRLEGRGLRTRMERSGRNYVVLVLLRGDAARAAEVQNAAESLGLGKPLQRSRKAVRQP